jgi:RNA polymerase sigma factor (sigma-70 family)
MGPTTRLLRTQSDERLAALARDGHELAFEAIVQRYRKPLLRAARRILPDARAEDAVQQAFLAAWRALRRGDEVRDLKPWLYRITQRTALNALRVRGYEHAQLEDALRVGEAPQEELERRTVVRETLAGLAGLPDRQRQALMATAIEGRSQAEVAAVMGLTEGAIRQLVHRARHSLRAAATALTPLPVTTWLAASSRGPMPERVVEMVAGAGAAGAGGVALLAKAGAVAVVAGGAVTGGVALEHETSAPKARAAQVRTVAAQPSASPAPAAARPVSSPAPAPASPAERRAERRADREDGAGRRRTPDPAAATPPAGDDRFEDEDDDETGDDSSGSGSSPVREDSRRGRGRGGDDDDSGSNSGSSGGDDDPIEADDDSSGSGSGSGSDDPLDSPDSDDPLVEPVETVEPEDDSSGSDDPLRETDRSGSGRSGSDD